ncbi:hypothetical protein NDU88_004769 [Pleurodeles waltl]|uniref:Uncharacterized protein n=1 Tax=Pleurodeles waltl TaxID=8319 RepID=A0AAV7RKF8_PLEWA|nr:hypothetical protein NDU88_004769 [Pleurodeles waltl]
MVGNALGREGKERGSKASAALTSSCGALRCLLSWPQSLKEPPESCRAPAAVRAAGARHPQLSRVNVSHVQSEDGLER